jgi:hypothetical protein
MSQTRALGLAAKLVHPIAGATRRPPSNRPNRRDRRDRPNRQFCNQYVRHPLGIPPDAAPIVSLAGYVGFWGWAFALITLAIALLKTETERFAVPTGGGNKGDDSSEGRQQRLLDAAASGTENGGGGGGGGVWQEIKVAYSQLLGVVRLRPIWALSLLLVTYRLGVLPAEGAASLKLLDKGVAKEALAALVLFQFPVELVSAVVAGRWG